MVVVGNQIGQLEAAIAAQEALRSSLGHAVVDLTISTLRERLEVLREQALSEPGVSPALAELRAHLPVSLAEKARALAPQRWAVGERKQVTVLFADLSGFTAIGERVDPEVVRSFQNDLFHEMASVVYQYEGFIEKFVGDAILSVFGAPVTHEDDADRALRAALAMRERMEGLNRAWVERLGQQLTLHIGINTGEVVAGQIGSELGGSYAVTGDTINTASRLQTAARPGQILVSPSTHRITHEAFAFRALEPIHVKGKQEPFPVFALERARLRPGKSRGMAGLRASIVGREQELARLEEVALDLTARRGAVVTVVGEAGIGKSRLISEWRARCRTAALRIRWLDGRCFGHTATRAYGPFLDLFRNYAEIRDEDAEVQAVSRMHQVVERMFPDNVEAHAIFANMLAMRASPAEERVLAGLSPPALRSRLFALVQDVFEHLAREQPTVLVLEDLHWADQSSLELLKHLLTSTKRFPLVFALVSRDDPDSPARDLNEILAAEYSDRLVQLALTPLSQVSSLTMAEQLLRTSDLPPPLVRLIVRKAEGNPFFVEEVIRSVIDRGALVPASNGEGWVVTSVIDSVTVPDTLKGVLMARLDRLPDETKRVAQEAAVIGRIFSYRVLVRLAQDAAGLEADLRHLEMEDLIRELVREPDLEYMFKHALTQDVAYESLLGARRREIHCRVGEAMEELFAQRLSEFHAILAEHFLRGEAWAKAFDHFVRAGNTTSRLYGNLYISTQSYANAEARVHYTTALEALSHLPINDASKRQQVDTTIKLASVSIFAEAPERLLGLMRRTEGIARMLRDAPDGTREDALQVARIHYWIGRSHHYRNELREAIAYYQEVLKVAQQFGDTELSVIPSLTLGRVVGVQGHFAEAHEFLNRATAPLEESENWSEWIWLSGFLGLVLAARGHYAAGVEQGQRALSRAEETRNATGVAASCILLAGIYRFGRDIERMRDAGRAALRASQDAGEHVYAQMAFGILGWAEGLLGKHAEAMQHLAEMDALGERLGGQVLLADHFAAARAEVALTAGRFEEAVALASQAVLVAQKSGGIFAEGLAHRAWALALSALPQAPASEVEEHLNASLRLFEAGDCRVEVGHTILAQEQVRARVTALRTA
jgi:class 3 adenylate cyclase/tetratricopeptide (TPR) repeat protein